MSCSVTFLPYKSKNVYNVAVVKVLGLLSFFVCWFRVKEEEVAALEWRLKFEERWSG